MRQPSLEQGGQTAGEGSKNFGAAWYEVEVWTGAQEPGRRLQLRFGSAVYHATVWLNGHQLGSHGGANVPFEFDLSDLGPGVNRLIVRVDNRRTPADLPPALAPFAAVPPLVTDIDLSVDDRMLYVSCWGTGELKQFDVSNAAAPREQRGQVGEGAGLEQRIEDPPVGAIPTDEQDSWHVVCEVRGVAPVV